MVEDARSMRRGTLVAVAITAALTTTTTAVAASKITSAQIKDGTIRGRDIAESTIGARELSNSVFSQLIGKTGASGAPGPQGPAGLAGPAGPAAATSVRRLDGPTVPQGASGSGQEVKTSTATCPPGSIVTGGGYIAGTIDDIVAYSYSSTTQYSVIAINEFSQSNSIMAQAICVAGPSATAARVRAVPASVAAQVKRLQAAVDAEGR